MKQPTCNIDLVYSLLNVECNDPKSFLGMHDIETKNSTRKVIRVYNPNAKNVKAINLNTKAEYVLKETDFEGFFEVVTNAKNSFQYKLIYESYDEYTWESYDSYAFPNLITDTDKYLFGESTHYEIYNKLGANITEVDGVKGVNFAVWAPSAKRVSVVGDFNNWDGRRHQMQLHMNGGIWELFIPELCEFDKYKFEIKTQENNLLEKTDPYGFYSEVRPNTASVVFDINKYKWKDKKWLTAREKNKTLDKPMNIYEVHLGSWMRIVEDDERFLTYRELADKLIPYVLDMNFTHIELLPVSEHPYDPSWGYQVTGYYAPTSRFGTPDDFKYFVDQCHQKGIGIILDWVPAHFPKDAHSLGKFDGTSLYEHANPQQGEHPDWGTLIFNFGRREVKNFLIANALFWLKEYHIDGLRVDAVASMLYLDYGKTDGNWIPNEYGGRENLEAVEFLKHLNSIVGYHVPSALVIAEESTSWGGVSGDVNNGGLGFSLKWNMGWMNDFLSYIEQDCVYRKYHHHNLTFSMIYAYTENFVLVLSHDEVVHGKKSLINKMPGDMWQKFANLRLTYAFMFGHPGKKLLFMGSEFGQWREWSEDRSLDWHLLDTTENKQLQDFVKDLGKLYKEEESLWANDFDPKGFQWIDCNDAERSVVSFRRCGNGEKEELIYVCNFTPVPLTNHILNVWFEGEYEEILNSDDLKYGGSGITNVGKFKVDENKQLNLKVPPLGVTVLKRIK